MGWVSRSKIKRRRQTLEERASGRVQSLGILGKKYRGRARQSGQRIDVQQSGAQWRSRYDQNEVGLDWSLWGITRYLTTWWFAPDLTVIYGPSQVPALPSHASSRFSRKGGLDPKLALVGRKGVTMTLTPTNTVKQTKLLVNHQPTAPTWYSCQLGVQTKLYRFPVYHDSGSLGQSLGKKGQSPLKPPKPLPLSELSDLLFHLWWSRFQELIK